MRLRQVTHQRPRVYQVHSEDWLEPVPLKMVAHQVHSACLELVAHRVHSAYPEMVAHPGAHPEVAAHRVHSAHPEVAAHRVRSAHQEVAAHGVLSVSTATMALLAGSVAMLEPVVGESLA